MLYLVQTVVTMGGHQLSVRWNQPPFFPLLPSWHCIRIHSRRCLFDGSPSTYNVDVHQHHVTDIVYRPSVLTFMAGSISHQGYRPWFGRDEQVRGARLSGVPRRSSPGSLRSGGRLGAGDR